MVRSKSIKRAMPSQVSPANSLQKLLFKINCCRVTIALLVRTKVQRLRTTASATLAKMTTRSSQLCLKKRYLANEKNRSRRNFLRISDTSGANLLLGRPSRSLADVTVTLCESFDRISALICESLPYNLSTALPTPPLAFVVESTLRRKVV